VSAAAGFTVKSGWATAVLVTGSVAAIRVIDSRRIDLSDPALPASRQPYHAGFGTARSAGAGLSTLVAAVERFGRASVIDAIGRYQRDGHQVRGVGIVVGSLIDPDTIANAHIRIHALEGRLFRQVVADAAAHRQLPCSIWRERDLYAAAALALGRREDALRRVLKECGDTAGGTWRSEEKAAALAAWLVVANAVGGRGSQVREPQSGPSVEDGGRRLKRKRRNGSG
jgi:hypothetical protein